MQTPSLSKQQQKAALSSKSNKKQPRLRIRNVYAQPYKPYWPLLPQDSGEELEDMLEKALKYARKLKKEAHKASLHKIFNEEQLKVKGIPAEQPEDQKKLWSFIVRGINEVTRGLEKDTIGCVLLSEDANPQHIATHIPRMCATNGVPVIVLHFLRTVTKRSLGFSCVALGFKKEVVTDTENHFYPVSSKIQQLAENLPPPDPHLPLFNIEAVDVKEQPVAEKAFKCSKSEKSTDLHLHRTSRKERAFIPNVSNVVKHSADFIPLSFGDTAAKICDAETKKINKAKVHYQPLVLKCTVPNTKKLKRLKAK